MTFKRNIGWEFAWYAVDSIGSVALFSSGFAVVPKIVFGDEKKYLKVVDYFDNLPSSTEASLSIWFESKKHLSGNGFANQILESQKGIFAYYDKYYTDIYECISVPNHEINIFQLPDFVQDFLKPFTLKDLVFAETESIKILDFFECVYGD